MHLGLIMYINATLRHPARQMILKRCATGHLQHPSPRRCRTEQKNPQRHPLLKLGAHVQINDDNVQRLMHVFYACRLKPAA
jgi:hypothetical protein